MLEKLKYTNYMNETIVFGEYPYFVNESDIHDYSWEYTTSSINKSLLSFRKEVTEKELPIVVMGSTAAELRANKNRLTEVFEKDAVTNQKGRLIYGNYYIEGVVFESEKSDYTSSNIACGIAAKFVTDSPVWIKETSNVFQKTGSQGGTDLDYPYDFPHDYMSHMLLKELTNAGFVPQNFKMIISGAVSNPTITIGGHEYSVDCDLAESETLTIDSISHKIYKTAADGSTENMFSNRNRESYIFEKIPVGTSKVMWDNSFKFEIVLFDERSEPKWT